VVLKVSGSSRGVLEKATGVENVVFRGPTNAFLRTDAAGGLGWKAVTAVRQEITTSAPKSRLFRRIIMVESASKSI